MMPRFFSGLALWAVFLFAAAFPVRARVITAGRLSSAIAVYESARPAGGKKFAVIGKVSLSAATPAELLDGMRRAAIRHGGDAVVNYKVLESGEVPATFRALQTDSGGASASEAHTVRTARDPSGASQIQLGTGGFKTPAAEGVVIKFDEKGIEAVGPDTVIPVL